MNPQQPRIGKNVIESLTLGMYEDCKYVYREYIQNSADQIDKAKSLGLFNDNEEGQIYININKSKGIISIEDNATGIQKDKVYSILANVACSTKVAGKDKGFRGIGRLGGLGYCSKMIFETSYKDEDTKSIMQWDAVKLRHIIGDIDNREDASKVISDVTEIEERKEKKELHYFKVILEGVTNEILLNNEKIKDYLQMVAPIEIVSKFKFRSKIESYMEENGFTVDTYNIYLNDEQLYKPYSNKIYEYDSKIANKKSTDEVLDINFLNQKDKNGETLYWGWYSISNFPGQMKPINLARGIRLRKENIQIGDEDSCKKFFKSVDEQRFSLYYFGEIYVVSNKLIPNSRRDYFSENETLSLFEKTISKDFAMLKDLCYDSSKTRNMIKAINKVDEDNKKLEEINQKGGFISKEQQEKFYAEAEEHKKKADETKKQLEKQFEKMEDKQSPFLSIAKEMVSTQITNYDNNNKETLQTNNKEQANQEIQPIVVTGYKKSKFRTDAPQYSKFDKKEKKLISRVYEVLNNALPKGLSETVILKLEEELTKK